jgi:hypothetical protein
MRVHKECVDEILSFISEKLRRVIVVLIPVEVQLYHKSCERCVYASGSLILFQPRREVE